MSALARAVATVGGVGYLRPAPGTWGSLAALPLAWILHVLGGFPLLALAIAAAYAAGHWATGVLQREGGEKDPSEIVIDEVVGQWVALIAVSLPAWLHGIDITALWPGWMTAFVLFRLFDIWKPGPVGRFDRRDDAAGVMLDDVAAGVLAALGVAAMAAFAHGVLGL
ncbi:MAG: phosphatidylglycerophosphatase A family protein [Marinibacterium sp.]